MTYTIMQFAVFYLLFPLIVKCCRSYRSSIVTFISSLVISKLISDYLNGWLPAFTAIPFFIVGIIAYYSVKENRNKLTVFGASAGVILASVLNGVLEDEIFIGFMIAVPFMFLVIASDGISFSNKIVVKLVDFFDKLSFTIYLMQGIMFVGVIQKFELSQIGIIIVAILGTFVLSVLVHYLYEKNVQKLLLRI